MLTLLVIIKLASVLAASSASDTASDAICCKFISKHDSNRGSVIFFISVAASPTFAGLCRFDKIP